MCQPLSPARRSRAIAGIASAAPRGSATPMTVACAEAQALRRDSSVRLADRRRSAPALPVILRSTAGRSVRRRRYRSSSSPSGEALAQLDGFVAHVFPAHHEDDLLGDVGGSSAVRPSQELVRAARVRSRRFGSYGRLEPSSATTPSIAAGASIHHRCRDGRRKRLGMVTNKGRELRLLERLVGD